MGVVVVSFAIELSLYECLLPEETTLIPYTFICTQAEAFSVDSYI
jgi:hypothetical protein